MKYAFRKSRLQDKGSLMILLNIRRIFTLSRNTVLNNSRACLNLQEEWEWGGVISPLLFHHYFIN